VLATRGHSHQWQCGPHPRRLLEQLIVQRKELGFTMIELMTTIVIVGILAALAIPAFGEQLARRRLEGVATDLSNDLQFARSQAVANNAVVRLMTLSTTQYVVRNAANVDLKTVNLPNGVAATNTVTVEYDPLRGTATTTNVPINVTSTQTAAQVRLDVNTMGRASICSPSGSLKGYATC
jgi:type IV fimbrial biogenesis protein FimT